MNAAIQQQTTGVNMTAKPTKTDLQKFGGIAGLIEAATFLFGMGLMFTMLAPYGIGELNEVVFGLGCILWFMWVGIVLLMGRK